MDPRARFEPMVSLPRCGLSTRLVALALEKLVYPKLLAAMDSTVLSDNRPRHLSDRLSIGRVVLFRGIAGETRAQCLANQALGARLKTRSALALSLRQLCRPPRATKDAPRSCGDLHGTRGLTLHNAHFDAGVLSTSDSFDEQAPWKAPRSHTDAKGFFHLKDRKGYICSPRPTRLSTYFRV
jgi:hypothetical protein